VLARCGRHRLVRRLRNGANAASKHVSQGKVASNVADNDDLVCIIASGRAQQTIRSYCPCIAGRCSKK